MIVSSYILNAISAPKLIILFLLFLMVMKGLSYIVLELSVEIPGKPGYYDFDFFYLLCLKGLVLVLVPFQFHLEAKI